MNLDRNKIIKAVAIIALLCVVVFAFTQIRQHNSLTLQDYAEQNPEFAYRKTEKTEQATEGGQGNDSEISEGNEPSENNEHSGKNELSEDEESSSDGAENSDASSEDASLSTNANKQDSTNDSDASASTLTGATLNGESVIELRYTYTDYFYYEPLSDKLRSYITGISYPDADSTDSATELAISYDELRYLHVMHYNFDGELVEGELICNKGIAQDLVEIFYELYRNEYQIEKILLIDEYNGDDTASMEDNNTSCFNYRLVEGTTSLSKHALGLALDINPFYNPYITYEKDGSEKVSPAAAIAYADRSAGFPYKIDENDLCYRLFKEYGFTWGGNWNSCKDYQHFQKVLP